MRIESMMAPRGAGERRATGDYLVEHYAEAENVGARVNAQPASLFGRHILRSAHYGAEHGLIRRAGRGRGEWSSGSGRSAPSRMRSAVVGTSDSPAGS